MVTVRQKVASFGCGASGAALLIAAAVVYTQRTGTEIRAWYNIPLCPAPWSPGLFLSRDLRGPAGAGAPTVSCAGAAGAASRAPDALALSLPTAWLLPGAVYAVVGYRSAGSDAVTAPAAVAVAVEGVFEYTSAFVGPARALRGAILGAANGGPQPLGRDGIGLKAWGPSGPTTTFYGVTGAGAIPANTLVYVQSRAPVWGAAVPGGYAVIADEGCDLPAGCAIVTPGPLDKDTYVGASLRSTDANSSAFALRVSVALWVNRTAGGVWPSYYLSLASSTVNPATALGVVLMFFGALALSAGTVWALWARWTCLDGCDGVGGVFACCFARRNAQLRAHEANRLGLRGAPDALTAPADAAAAAAARSIDNPAFAPRPGAGCGGGGSMAREAAPACNVYLSWGVAGGSAVDTAPVDGRRCAAQAVQRLMLDENRVRSVGDLGMMPNLRIVVLSRNELTSLGGLATSGQLLGADLSQNSVDSLRGVPEQLTWLDASANDVTCLAGLRTCAALTFLSLASNKLRSIRGIATACPALRCVDLRDNDLPDASELGEIATLERVDVSGNFLCYPANLVPATHCRRLTWLDASENCFNALARRAVEAAFAGRGVTLRL